MIAMIAMIVLPALFERYERIDTYIEHLHWVGFAGSNPVAPTIEMPGHKAVCFVTFFDAAAKCCFIPK